MTTKLLIPNPPPVIAPPFTLDELWEFDERGLMRRREASINDISMLETDRKFFWPAPGPRPADHPGIPDVK
jgi:nuclear transport factor 2 (NTF2) superfamily protein